MSDIHDDLIGFIYINESFGPENIVNHIEKKTDSRIPNFFYIEFDTNLQDFDVENRNHRYYDANNIMDCIRSEKIQSLLNTGGWFGEFDHPAPEKVGEKLSPQRIQNVPPEYRAFKIMSPKLVGNILTAKIQSAQGNVGEGFAKEVLAGWIPQFSARAIAHMINKGGKPYVHVNRLITYDAPWYPSHKVAHATSLPKIVTRAFTESADSPLETASDKINGVMIPLKEILLDVGRTDVNVNTIMEAFDLSDFDLMGFNDTRDHVMIKDENNVVYTKVNPNTVKRVNEFYNSFNL